MLKISIDTFFEKAGIYGNFGNTNVGRQRIALQ
jgi:hypothetical protein